jgi:uncharacterized HAD superfamily protein
METTTSIRISHLACEASSTMETPSIAIDLGGTIEDSWHSKRMWFALRGFDLGPWPRCRMEIVQSIGGQEALYDRMAEEVYNDTNILNRQPVEDVVVALHTMAEQFRLVIVSSRTEKHRPITVEWLRRHSIIGLIDEIAFLGANNSKLEWCLDAGVGALIDDDVRHLESIGEHNRITRIHFCARPLSEQQLNHNLLCATNWKEILQILQTLAP